MRMDLDLRNSPEDLSQRMLKAIEPGSVLPIHRHRTSSGTVVCIRGHFEELLYDDTGNLVEIVDMVPGGTVLLEAEDGKYEPVNEEDVLDV